VLMSEGLRARIAAADRAYDRRPPGRSGSAQERIASALRMLFVASVSAALEAGEPVDVLQAIRDGGIGHQPHEFISWPARSRILKT
jgi:hypothetical protein